MYYAIFSALFAAVAIWELRPMIKQKRRRDVVGFCIVLALAAAITAAMLVTISDFQLKNYLW